MSILSSELGPHGDIVMSSRVRFARNLAPYDFPQRITIEGAKEVSQLVKKTLEKNDSDYKNTFHTIRMKKTDEIERQLYVEEHMISPALAQNTEKGELLINKQKGCSLMLHEEDHIRIQCLRKGLQPMEAFLEADRIDDWLGKHLPYAYDERLGYLTACPTNIGSGLRVSVMLHLPALTMMGYLEDLIRAAGQLGFTVRGVFGEGSGYLGNLYQISNQVTLNVKEQEIVTNIEDIAGKVIDRERAVRKSVLCDQKLELEDRVFRSLGILKYAQLIKRKEAMHLISDVILGTSLGVISAYSLSDLHKLMAQIQPAYLQKQSGTILTEKEREQKRAAFIRETLK
ncbi:protein arginine kinase [Tindallia californiensis]|uniref:Protein-arginine kinase n=1 Tax=Tindallia californiensis TaxID=159292 RepID=A0A1H3RA13_9FIRM|nr:protein arginine kinase [Tindallia californiensis]SDZ22145.1 protein arginine kinase [Tindallia californiensis]